MVHIGSGQWFRVTLSKRQYYAGLSKAGTAGLSNAGTAGLSNAGTAGSPAGTGNRYISIDVECAATGKGHNDRAPCRIGAVDGNGRQLLDVTVHVPNLYDPLTVFTGLTRKQIDQGTALKDALATLRRHCGPHVIIVGQSVHNDIRWLGLVQGKDYSGTVDLAEVFAAKVGKRTVRFSLRNAAFGLLNRKMSQTSHNPVQDAAVSMQLYNT
jgi:RNA exonuclease 4